jgi:hypothetical protein
MPEREERGRKRERERERDEKGGEGIEKINIGQGKEEDWGARGGNMPAGQLKISTWSIGQIRVRAEEGRKEGGATSK